GGFGFSFHGLPPQRGGAGKGNVERNGTSLRSTPSPRVVFVPVRNPSPPPGGVSITSSGGRRPLREARVVPAGAPSRCGFAVGSTSTFSRSISAGFTPGGWFSPGTPVRNTCTRSLRGVGGA